ncbi:MAG: acyltransferase family protein [Nocardioides sp.]
MTAATTHRPALAHRPDLAWTSYLRTAAILAVVLIHVAGMSYLQIKDHDSRAWQLATLLTFGTKWAVPVFVMVSGALLLRPPQDRSPMAFYRRRLARIGIPLVVWHVVYIAVFWFILSDASWERLVARLIAGQVFTGLYFFWLILGLYIVTPVLWPLVESLSRRALLVTAILVTALPAVDLVTRRIILELGGRVNVADPTLTTQFLPYVGYFLLGYALRDVVVGGWRLWLLALITIALSIELTVQSVALRQLAPSLSRFLDTVSPVSYQGPLLGLCAVGVFLVAHSLIPESSPLASPRWSKRARRMGDYTFGVFCVHLLIAYGLSRLMGHPSLWGARSVGGILAYNALVIGLAFLVSAAMSRIPFVRRAV